MDELADRRIQSAARIEQLKAELTQADQLARDKACVYATGSFGRREAGIHSDLDLFIVGKEWNTAEGKPVSALKSLDEICLKADLIEATRKLKIPEFSGDGRYLSHYCVRELTKTLGTPHDDVTNTFTARLLLLLESFPLVETAVYDDIISDVVLEYWRDYEGHSRDFMPAFLANDILRLWRTFCVNYEARTARIPDREKAKGKLKNYKLKHSRLLTCYSALLYLMSMYRLRGTVSPQDAVSMIKLSPTERLEWLTKQENISESRDAIEILLDHYKKFLARTNKEEDELVSIFMHAQASKEYTSDAHKFGDLVFDVLTTIGKDNPFYRLLVV